MRTDVVVIGAGAAGLACASALADTGLSVTVLEARDRIGGRIHSVVPPGTAETVELGAQVVHGDRAACWDVLGEPGLHRRYGERTPMTVRLAGRLYPAFSLVQSAGCLLWQADARIAASAPADIPAGQVLRAVGGRPGIDDEWVRQSWGAAPARLSAGGMADVLAAADSGTGEFVVTGGFSELPRLLADGLDVHTSSPAQKITWTSGAVSVHADHVDYAASACVVTVPPPVVTAGRCEIADLPPAKRAAAAALESGDAVGVAIVLSQPAPESALVFDADGEAGFWKTEEGSAVALGVAKDSAAEGLRKRLADRTALHGLLLELVPWTGAATVESVTVADWGRDPWAGGAFTFPPAGRLDAAAEWALPMEDTVFFAGEATCGSRHPASVHGAMESGRRAAAQVREAVGS